MEKFLIQQVHTVDDEPAFWSEEHQRFLPIEYATEYDSKETARDELYGNHNVPFGMYQILEIVIEP